MRQNLALAGVTATMFYSPLAAFLLTRSDDNEAAARAICQPQVVDPNAPQPPCAHIEYLEAMCWPKGDQPVHFDAHQQCMCKGSYFSEWTGCQNCLKVHGFRNDRDFSYYTKVMSKASSMLCDSGTPTAPLRSIFTDAEKSIPPLTTGGTVLSDHFPGKTDVGLYYTASGPQGTGEVTGPAATVTRVGGLATADPFTMPSSTSTSMSRQTSSTTSAGEPTPTDSSANTTGSTLGLVVAAAAVAAFSAWS